MSRRQAGVEKRKRQDTELKIILPARPSSKRAPAVDNDSGDSADEVAADPLAAHDPPGVVTEDDWTPPPVSSISEAPAPKKSRKSTKNLGIDNDRIDDLADPGVSSDIDLSDSPVSSVTAASTKLRKKPGPKVKPKVVEELPKPEDLSKSLRRNIGTHCC
jgi:hypothetical protein